MTGAGSCRRVVAVAIALGAATMAAGTIAPAQAAYPGSNGALVYTTDRDGDYELWKRSVAPNGDVTHEQLTTNDLHDDRATYSPDGQRLAFVRQTATGGADIWVMTAAGHDARPVTRTEDVVETSPSWSPDGTRVAYAALIGTGRAQNWEVFVAHVDDDVPAVNITAHEADDQFPAWSVNDVIAFQSNRRSAGSSSDIYTTTPSGGTTTALGVGLGNPRWPSWSPDGSALAFVGWDKTNNIYVRDAEGSISRITDGPFHEDPAWSPDGEQIVYVAEAKTGRNITHRLFVVDAQPGATPAAISDGGGNDYAPDWQPVLATATSSPSPCPLPPLCLS